jgi:hypothetical protein
MGIGEVFGWRYVRSIGHPGWTKGYSRSHQ